MIPIIFIVYVGSKVEKWLKKVVPAVIAHNVNSFLTILITVPLAILVVGPVTNVLSSLISAGVSGLYGISPVVTSLVVALLYQPLVIFGLHWPISAIGITNLAQSGVDYIFPMSFTANFAQTAVVLAVFYGRVRRIKRPWRFQRWYQACSVSSNRRSMGLACQ